MYLIRCALHLVLGAASIRVMKYIDEVLQLGGAAAVARALKLASPTVFAWRRIPERYCAELERWKKGRITAETLRPDVRWVRVDDPSWPHPKGRPLLDYARPLTEV